MLGQRRYVPTATMIITPMLARHMATTAQNGSSMACLSERGRGITGITGIVASTAAATTVVATMAAAITGGVTSADVAGTTTVFEVEDSIMKALGAEAASMVEVSSTAVEDSTVEATVAGFMAAATVGMAGTDK